MNASGYAVIDLETTGLFPGGHDRIVEIGVVLVDADGAVRDEWTTLVNPQRDLGPSHVHGIYGRHAKHAPLFADVSDELVELLDGRTLVAHNAGFDTRFLAAEWARLGVLHAPELPFGHVCTMRLARTFLPGSGRTLLDCCAAFDIEIYEAHSALGDARATAALLAAYRAVDPHADAWRETSASPVDAARLGRRGTRAPVVPREVAFTLAESARDLQHAAEPSSRPARGQVRLHAPASPRAESSGAAQPPSSERSSESAARSLLTRVVSVMPADETASPGDDAYLALLDRCLEDSLLTVTEADSLASLADATGISDARRRRLHERYFESVVATAWADEVLTEREVAELDQLAAVLEISDEQRAEARAPRSRGRRARRQSLGASANAGDAAATSSDDGLGVPTSTRPPASRRPDPFGLHLAAGDHVVLTGSMRRKRDEWTLAIQQHGFVVHPAVTKKTRVLVAADPDSLSGKARKARQYGVPIVSEDWLDTRLLLIG